MVIHKFFHPLVLNEQRADYLAGKMMTEYLYASDENRDPKTVWSNIYRYFSGDPNMGMHVAYEIGNGEGFDGILMFADIIPGFRCTMALKYWEPHRFSHNMVREAIGIIGTVAEKLKLTRMNTETGDPLIVKLAKMVGFEEEGVRKRDFMWNGVLHDRYFLGKVLGTTGGQNG